jgi:acyl carrier protein
MQNFNEKFLAVLTDTLSVEQEMLNRETTFHELGADSLDMMEVIMAFEKEFGITIPDEDAETIKTVGDAENYLIEKLKIIP